MIEQFEVIPNMVVFRSPVAEAAKRAARNGKIDPADSDVINREVEKAMAALEFRLEEARKARKKNR